MTSDLRSVRESLRRFIALLGCLLCLGQAVGAEQPGGEIYMARIHDSVWTFKSTGALCELAHEIPPFGRARFLRVAGESLTFRIDSDQPVPTRTEAILREVSPAWHHTPPDPLEQRVEVASGGQPISLQRRAAAWLLSSLAKGQIGSFDLPDWNDSRRQIHIRLSPVNFQRPYRAFRQCISGLSGKGYERYRHTTVHFATALHRLGPEARKALKEVAEYIKALGDVKAVNIAGYADDRGKRRNNLRLSAQRARSVADFLVAQGVSPSLLNSHHYGESRPKVRARSEAARAANRRVEIELVR
jgi:sodium-type flagellar protein MotY